MILGMALNTILDPIMIFGLLGFPAMGMRGAALATVVAQAVSTVWLFHLLHTKHRLLVFGNWRIGEWLASFRRIAAFGIPGVMSMILMPVSATIITRIVSGFGNEAVAGSGAAGRLEMFAFVIPMALGISLTPFVSQNFGAGRLDRICEARAASTRFALIYGGVVAAAFIVCAPWLAAVFTDDAKVAETMIAHIRIISLGYGMMEVHRYSGFFLIGMQRPAAAMLLNALRVVVVLIPLSYLGAYVLGVRGVFLGRLVTDVLVGSISLVCVSRICKSLRQR
jgi:Na+-driven multidrug efflux pump